MSNSYRGQSNKNSSSVSNAGFVLIGVALLMVVVVLVLLCARCAKQNSSGTLNEDYSLSCTISAQDSTGKDVTESLAITRSTNTPSDVNPDDAILVNVAWNGKKAASFPLVLTIQDSSYTDGDGLVVFQCKNGQWTEIGTYMISNASVSFPVESLSDFAFILYDRYMEGLNPEPEETEEPELSPSPSVSPTASPSPSPSPSPSASPTATAKQSSNNGNSNNVYGTATPVPVTTSSQDNTTPVPTYNPGGYTSSPATTAPTEIPVTDPTENPSGGGGESEASSSDAGGGNSGNDSDSDI